MEYKNAISTIEVDHDFPRNLTEDVMPGNIREKFRLFPLAGDARTARKQLRTIEDIMTIPSHPNIPSMTAKVIDIHAPIYIVLKEVGEKFLDVKDNLSTEDRIKCFEQLKWAVLYLHGHNITHGNISFENLRFKSLTPISVQLIALQNANLWPKEIDKKKDMEQLANICKALNIVNETEDIAYSIEVVQNDKITTYDYDTLEEISPDLKHDPTYVSRGTFAAISIESLTSNEIDQLVKLSTHEHLITIYRKESVRSPVKNALLMDYYHEAETLDNVIHGTETYYMKDALTWIIPLLQVVKFIGDQKLVHGAICPENIIKTNHGVKLICLENIFKKTRDTRLLYLHPDRATSNQKSSCPTSDGYSLQVVNYEILTRRYPAENWRSQEDWVYKYIGRSEDHHQQVPRDCYKFLFKPNFNMIPFEERTIEQLPAYMPPQIEALSLIVKIARCLDNSGDASIYEISFAVRHFDILVKGDNIILPILRSCPYTAPQAHFPLNEFAATEKQKLVCFHPITSKHVQLEPSAPTYSKKYQNRAISVDCDCDTPCVDMKGAWRMTHYTDYVWMNRPLEYGEAIKLVIHGSEGASLSLNFVSKHYERKFRTNRTGWLTYGKWKTNRHVVCMYRLTDKLVYVQFYRSDKTMRLSVPLLIPSDLSDILFVSMPRGTLKSMTIEHAYEQTVRVSTGMSVKPSIADIRPFKIAFGSAPTGNCTLLYDSYTKGPKINCLDLISYRLCCIVREFGSHRNPLFVNVLGFSRNDVGITGIILKDVAGNLWDTVIMNSTWTFNLPQVYRWIKQIACALQLCVFSVNLEEFYGFTSKSVFLTEELNAKLFCTDMTYGVDERIIDSPTETTQNPQIDVSAGEPELRELIEKCWAIDPKVRPTLEEIVELATRRLTQLELPFRTNNFVSVASMNGGEFSQIEVVEIPEVGHVVCKYFKNMSDLFMKREVEALRLAIGNPFFPICHGIVGTYEHIEGVLLEKLRGDMWNEIIQNKALSYGAFEISSWAWQVSSAILFLHNNGIVHRDIKPANVLVSYDFETIKLVDFGIMTYSGKTTDFQGTHRYCAPEAKEMERGRYNSTMDVYSFGVTIYELIERKDFIYSDTKDVTLSVKTDTAHMSFFIERCCSHNPQFRPRTKDVVSYLKNKKEQFVDNRSLLVIAEAEQVQKNVQFE